MSQATPKGKQCLTGITVESVLLDGVLDILAFERVLQFGGEDRNAVEEYPQVETLLVLLAEIKLTDDGELVGLVMLLRFFVQARGRAEVGELKLAAGILDAFAENVECASLGDFRRESLKKPGLHVVAVVLLEFLPFLGLRGVNEIQNYIGIETERAVVVVRFSFAVAAWKKAVFGAFVLRRVGAECCFDGRFKVFFGSIRWHVSVTSQLQRCLDCSNVWNHCLFQSGHCINH